MLKARRVVQAGASFDQNQNRKKLANKAAKRKRKKAKRAAQNQAQDATSTDLAN